MEHTKCSMTIWLLEKVQENEQLLNGNDEACLLS